MRKRFCIAIIAAGMLLTGCSSGPDLSRVNNDLEAEYMAGLILKNDSEYGKMLDYDRSILTATPTPEPTIAPAPTQTQSGTDPAQQTEPDAASSAEPAGETYVDVKDVVNVQGIRVTPQTYELKNTYGTEYASLSARSGKRLFIVKFRIKNTSSSERKVNMNKKGFDYQLSVDGNTVGSPLMTILQEDLQYYQETIPAGKSREAVLIFEVDKKLKITDAHVNVSNGTGTAQWDLQ